MPAQNRNRSTARFNCDISGDRVSNESRYAVSIDATQGRDISHLIFGGNVEFMSRQIYGGVWDRERNIPRADVKAAIGALGTTMLRWPGSSSASTYHWRDGIGAQPSRPFYETTFWTAFADAILEASGVTGSQKTRLLGRIDPSQPNLFGTDEFLQYCLDLGIEPVLSVNIGGGHPRGEGTPQEVADWVRYCNVDRRSPRSVRWWQLGNEVWGVHEPGHQVPKAYGQRVIELATAMRSEDPTVKIVTVAVGVRSSDFTPKMAAELPDIDRWNRDVFSVAAEHSDSAALNWFFPGAIGRLLRDNEADALQMTAGSDVFGTALDRVIADLDCVGGPASRLPIYVAEWGRQVTFPEGLLSDNHRLYDGVFYAGCFNRILERSRRVRMAGFAHSVNASAPIQTIGDRHFVTAAYLVTQLYRSTCRREHVPVIVKSENMLVPALEDVEKAFYVCERARSDRKAAILDATATVDESGTTVYLSNRGLRDPITVELSGFALTNQDARFSYVTADSPFTVNTIDAPNAIRLAETVVVMRDGRGRVTIPPCTAGALVVGGIAGALACQ